MSLGAPSKRTKPGEFLNESGVRILTEVEDCEDPELELEKINKKLDYELGGIFSSSYEFPNRYSRWSLGLVNPPLVLESRDRQVELFARSEKGIKMLNLISNRLNLTFAKVSRSSTSVIVKIEEPKRYFSEEERSKQNSVFSLVRVIRDIFSCEDTLLGLYGAFGYDLAFQFQRIEFCIERSKDQRNLVLFIPDEILVVDQRKEQSWIVKYDFFDTLEERKDNFQLMEIETGFCQKNSEIIENETSEGEYAKWVEEAREAFARGDMFECVLSQVFRKPLLTKPSEIFESLKSKNQAPFSFCLNLGRDERLIGASPEIFLRVEKTDQGLRVESCPISGTIKRGESAEEDHEQIKRILADTKEESELTMCTDVDRNDKSRVCIPESVKIIGRRQIEIYRRLIHTVDHVEGILKPGCDALDAFLSHTWAVTVTGAPKKSAMEFIEKHEKSERRFYAGAVGRVSFDGSLNTGLTLRTIAIKNGICEVRAGATLLYDSNPQKEEEETELKASALLEVLTREETQPTKKRKLRAPGSLLIVDFEDSFIFTLQNYFLRLGCSVETIRYSLLQEYFENSNRKIDLVVLSPGPFSPKKFDTSNLISFLRQKKLPLLGVCLGMQAICEFFGGELRQLSTPAHGKSSRVILTEEGKNSMFSSSPDEFQVARYHSLCCRRPLPSCLRELAVSMEEENFGDGKDWICMGLKHESEKIFGVQFHPESIMTGLDIGLPILEEVTRICTKKD